MFKNKYFYLLKLMRNERRFQKDLADNIESDKAGKFRAIVYNVVRT